MPSPNPDPQEVEAVAQVLEGHYPTTIKWHRELARECIAALDSLRREDPSRLLNLVRAAQAVIDADAPLDPVNSKLDGALGNLDCALADFRALADEKDDQLVDTPYGRLHRASEDRRASEGDG